MRVPLGTGLTQAAHRRQCACAAVARRPHAPSAGGGGQHTVSEPSQGRWASVVGVGVGWPGPWAVGDCRHLIDQNHLRVFTVGEGNYEWEKPRGVGRGLELSV